jgi:hypothetical protein
MSYSRRQLEALGEPLGECVTRKEGGRVIYGGGGGNSGGGGGSSAPQQQTSYQYALQPEMVPYAQDILGKTQTLTAANYTPYQGQRIADFTPLQNQAMGQIAGQQVAGQVGAGSMLAGGAGMYGLGAQSNYENMATNPNAVQAYMSPYQQNVTDYQKSQALRDFQMAQPMRNAAAVSKGAFGGTRSALVDAEAQRNLNSQLQGIQATGTQNAYQDAMRNMQFGTQTGLTGAQLAGQAGATLGQLGQQQYGQETGINQAQLQTGALQQQQEQQGLTQNYQDFLKQQEYPYSQLAFYNSMLRGLSPVMPTTTQTYTSPPNYLAQLGGLGLGAYSLGKLAGV